MQGRAGKFAAEIWQALDGPPARLDALRFTGTGALPSAFAVTDLAAGSVAAAGLALAEFLDLDGPMMVDRRLAAFWFAMSIRPEGWSLPAARDPLAGDYAARDGWIRLHTNARHHRAAAERVLGHQVDGAGMARAVAAWTKEDLEAAIVAEGGCAAEMRGVEEWAAHPQGRAVAPAPAARRHRRGDGLGPGGVRPRVRCRGLGGLNPGRSPLQASRDRHPPPPVSRALSAARDIGSVRASAARRRFGGVCDRAARGVRRRVTHRRRSNQTPSS